MASSLAALSNLNLNKNRFNLNFEGENKIDLISKLANYNLKNIQ